MGGKSESIKSIDVLHLPSTLMHSSYLFKATKTLTYYNNLHALINENPLIVADFLLKALIHGDLGHKEAQKVRFSAYCLINLCITDEL